MKGAKWYETIWIVLTFSWVQPVLEHGSAQPLEIEDLYELAYEGIAAVYLCTINFFSLHPLKIYTLFITLYILHGVYILYKHIYSNIMTLILEII